MNKLFGFLLSVLLIAAVAPLATAAEKTVQITIAHCEECGGLSGVDYVLEKTKGVKKWNYKGAGTNTFVINFEDSETNMDIITVNLMNLDYIIQGEPIFLK